MKQPQKPLFIIDSSQTHGRGYETEWVSCTSASCPFIASVVVIDEQEYARHYDPSDTMTAYSEAHNGVRQMVHVTNIGAEHDPSQLRTLLRKLVKELMLRKAIVEYSPEAPSDEAIIKFIEILQGQNRENLRTEPNEQTHRTVYALLKKLHDDYSNKN